MHFSGFGSELYGCLSHFKAASLTEETSRGLTRREMCEGLGCVCSVMSSKFIPSLQAALNVCLYCVWTEVFNGLSQLAQAVLLPHMLLHFIFLVFLSYSSHIRFQSFSEITLFLTRVAACLFTIFFSTFLFCLTHFLCHHFSNPSLTMSTPT